MPRNMKVKGFCAFCGDPVVTGGRRLGNKWYHNPCFVAASYGAPQNVVRNKRPRRSAPPRKEIRERSEMGLNPMMEFSENPVEDLEILAHAKNVTLASNPPGVKPMYYIWQGSPERAQNIIRFKTYPQANRYYRDVIDGKVGVGNPRKFGKVLPIAIGVIVLGIIVFWVYKNRDSMGKKAGAIKNVLTSQGTGTVETDGFGGLA